MRAFLRVTERGYLAAVAEPASALLSLERVIPQRDALMAPYAAWLQANGILRDSNSWRDAITNEFLPATPFVERANFSNVQPASTSRQ